MGGDVGSFTPRAPRTQIVVAIGAKEQRRLRQQRFSPLPPSAFTMILRRGLLLLLFALGGRAQDGFDDDIGGGEDAGYLMPNPPPPPAKASDAASSSSCIFKAPTGEAFDLTPMMKTDHDFTGTTNGGYAYRFNVCGNTVKLCNAQPAPASKWRGTKCNNLGDPSTQTVSLLDSTNPSAGLRIKYTQGDICKRQVDGQMEISSRLISYEVRNQERGPAEARERCRAAVRNARGAATCARPTAAPPRAPCLRSHVTLPRTPARCAPSRR